MSLAIPLFVLVYMINSDHTVSSVSDGFICLGLFSVETVWLQVSFINYPYYYTSKWKWNLLQLVTDRDPGPGKSRSFLSNYYPGHGNFQEKPELTGTIYTKVLFFQDCKHLF